MLQRIAPFVALVALAGCPRGAPVRDGRHATAPGANAEGDPAAERVALPGQAPLYLYAATITTYPADDRGAYVVDVEAGVAGDAARAQLGDDVIGEAGRVVRLSAEERGRVATMAGVRGVRALQPVERAAPSLAARAAAAGDAIDVRIELFADARAAEVDAVAAWIEAAHGRVTWRGPTALTATVPSAAIVRVPRLSPVRWVE